MGIIWIIHWLITNTASAIMEFADGVPVRVNGKTKLACIERVDGYESLELEPASNRKVVRDLVVL